MLEPHHAEADVAEFIASYIAVSVVMYLAVQVGEKYKEV
jgi:hypothetical protein